MSQFLTLAFGDLETATWGAAWLPGPDARARLAAGRGGEIEVLQVSLRPGAPEEPWRLEGDGVSIAFSPQFVPAPAASATDGLSTADQLCAVSGHVRLGGADVEVECLGWRSSAQAETDLRGLDSFRFVSAWLDPRHGFSLTSLRPRKARGQEADAVAAVVIDDPAPPPVDDPRLSTTYTDAGLPLRAGLELWFAEPGESEAGAGAGAEAAEAEAGETRQYPRRAAGEAAGPRADWELEGFSHHAALLSWRSHGHDGPGIYVLGQHR